MIELELGELYRYSLLEYGDTVELRLYENRVGREKDFDWGIAGEVIAKRVGKIKGVNCATYSPALQCLSVKISKDAEGVDGIVRSILNIACEVLTRYATALGRAKLVLEDFDIEPS
ncbi:MAG: hypothetical protein DRP01_11340 [Archaeoglobales archaeon]|nr:MAG: hypothetical protein DRP01_11340 [Archaeoglobales archaeon]